MLRVQGLPTSRADRPAALTIGNFDGIHRGHGQLLARLRERAQGANAEAVVLTFDPHPRCVLRPDQCPQSLTTLDERATLLDAAGVDTMVVVPFTHELSTWTARAFCDRLTGAFTVRDLVVGTDFALGHNRTGDIPFLTEYGRVHGFEVTPVEPVTYDSHPVSSTRIRNAVLNGDVAVAADLLGHPYFLDSVVERGERVGKQIGFPTANLSIASNKCLPAPGVYSMWLRVGGTWLPAATNVGYRPTFGGNRVTVEAYILDFDRDIYGEKVRGAFVDRLREERAYPTVDELVEQIRLDVDELRERFGRAAPPSEI